MYNALNVEKFILYRLKFCLNNLYIFIAIIISLSGKLKTQKFTTAVKLKLKIRRI